VVVDGNASGASRLGLDGFVVVTAAKVDGELHQLMETTAARVGCPSCGVVAVGHGHRRASVRDLPAGGRPVALCWAKRVWRRCHYVRRVQEGGCFICGIVDGDPERPAHIVYREDRHIAFLPNWHVLLGYVLVAPVDHVEAVADDFTAEEYLDLQRLVHRVARAVTLTVPTERVYILSLGSQQGNAHVHWHVTSLPPGVAYKEQQYAALMVETKGHLAMTPDEQSSLAQQLRSVIRTVD